MAGILVMEADHGNRGVLSDFLRHRGWQVWEAEDDEAALQTARHDRPQAVLCDLTMPRCNGLRLCRALRSNLLLHDVRIVVLTGPGSGAEHLAALEAGADKVVAKPVKPEELHRLLSSLIAGGVGDDPAPDAAPVSEGNVPFIRFWGVRGSIPAPGPGTVHYGGNTTCLELRAGGQIVILDAGSGLRLLGNRLQRESGEALPELHLVLSHAHLDHLLGLPFFSPVYHPRCRLRILGYSTPNRSLADTLGGIMAPPYFPVELRDLPGRIEIVELKDKRFSIGPLQVEAFFVNHPGRCAGYRFRTSGGDLVFLPDAEIAREGGAPVKRARTASEAAEDHVADERRLTEFVKNAEVLIMDSQYNAAEYAERRGWGHACVDDVVQLAVAAGVKRLVLFHHDPAHDDETISRKVAHARALAGRLGGCVAIEAAREGLEIPLPAGASAAQALGAPR